MERKHKYTCSTQTRTIGPVTRTSITCTHSGAFLSPESCITDDQDANRIRADLAQRKLNKDAYVNNRFVKYQTKSCISVNLKQYNTTNLFLSYFSLELIIILLRKFLFWLFIQL